MPMEMIWIWIGAWVLGELFEAWWQRAETMSGVLERVEVYYSRSIFVLFGMHPTIIIALLLLSASWQVNGWLLVIMGLKLFDLLTKIYLVRQLLSGEALDAQWRDLLNRPLPPWIFLTGVGLYPVMLYYALV
jgi:hypothetical protein